MKHVRLAVSESGGNENTQPVQFFSRKTSTKTHSQSRLRNRCGSYVCVCVCGMKMRARGGFIFKQRSKMIQPPLHCPVGMYSFYSFFVRKWLFIVGVFFIFSPRAANFASSDYTA